MIPPIGFYRFRLKKEGPNNRRGERDHGVSGSASWVGGDCVPADTNSATCLTANTALGTSRARVCGLCVVAGEGTHYCWACGEYLCNECSSIHGRSKNHRQTMSRAWSRVLFCSFLCVLKINCAPVLHNMPATEFFKSLVFPHWNQTLALDRLKIFAEHNIQPLQTLGGDHATRSTNHGRPNALLGPGTKEPTSSTLLPLHGRHLKRPTVNLLLISLYKMTIELTVFASFCRIREGANARAGTWRGWRGWGRGFPKSECRFSDCAVQDLEYERCHAQRVGESAGADSE